MTLFQYLAVGFLALLIVRDLAASRATARAILLAVAQTALWTSAGVAVLFPSLVQDVAAFLGIGRGADVVLYLTVLAFLVAATYQYAWNLQLEEKLTVLVRDAALRDAEFGGSQFRERPEGSD